ncbi:hypothetical protein T484DRAFT_1929915 [Baffinella frigidus]|nr:hypothetical protein T484DRAFT_1929915 [Cryptophyta sp. CCMP2293]
MAARLHALELAALFPAATDHVARPLSVELAFTSPTTTTVEQNARLLALELSTTTTANDHDARLHALKLACTTSTDQLALIKTWHHGIIGVLDELKGETRRHAEELEGLKDNIYGELMEGLKGNRDYVRRELEGLRVRGGLEASWLRERLGDLECATASRSRAHWGELKNIRGGLEGLQENLVDVREQLAGLWHQDMCSF